MAKKEQEERIQGLLGDFQGIDPLKNLFWSELNYNRINESLSRRGWTETASDALAEDPVLFAASGTDDAFHVVYSRLNSKKLLLGLERPVASKLISEHPYALFIFSNLIEYWISSINSDNFQTISHSGQFPFQFPDSFDEHLHYGKSKWRLLIDQIDKLGLVNYDKLRVILVGHGSRHPRRVVHQGHFTEELPPA